MGRTRSLAKRNHSYINRCILVPKFFHDFPQMQSKIQEPVYTDLYTSDYVLPRILFYPFFFILGPYATIGSIVDYIYSSIDSSAGSKLRMEYYSEYKAGPWETFLNAMYRIVCEPWIFLYHFTLTIVFLAWPVMNWSFYVTAVFFTNLWDLFWFTVATIWLVFDNFYFSLHHMINHYDDFIKNDWSTFSFWTLLFPINWIN